MCWHPSSYNWLILLELRIVLRSMWAVFVPTNHSRLRVIDGKVQCGVIFTLWGTVIFSSNTVSEYFNYIYFQIGTILLENGDKLRQSTDSKHLERKTNHISQEGQTPCLLPTTRRSPFFSMDVLVVVAKAREVRLQDNDRGSILKCAVFFYVLWRLPYHTSLAMVFLPEKVSNNNWWIIIIM